jgi:hypothetical protein
MKWSGHWPGWEPIRAALCGELTRAGWGIEDVVRITRNELARRWFEPVDWTLLPQEAYEALAAGGKEVFTPPYQALYDTWLKFRASYEEDSKFIEPLLCNALNPDEAVLEAGYTSVATILAAEAVRCRCFAVDPRPGSCELALTKWETLTGRRAEKA